MQTISRRGHGGADATPPAGGKRAPGASRSAPAVLTRWDGPASNSSNEHQQEFKLGFGSRFTYTIPSIQSHQHYVFKVQGYAGTWSPWHEKRFTTKGVTYEGYLYQRKK